MRSIRRFCARVVRIALNRRGFGGTLLALFAVLPSMLRPLWPSGLFLATIPGCAVAWSPVRAFRVLFPFPFVLIFLFSSVHMSCGSCGAGTPGLFPGLLQGLFLFYQ